MSSLNQGAPASRSVRGVLFTSLYESGLAVLNFVFIKIFLLYHRYNCYLVHLGDSQAERNFKF